MSSEISVNQKMLVDVRRCKSLEQVKSTVCFYASTLGDLKGSKKAIALFIISKVKDSKRKTIYNILTQKDFSEARVNKLILSDNSEKLFRHLFRACAASKEVSYDSLIEFVKFFSFKKDKKHHMVRKIFEERYKKTFVEEDKKEETKTGEVK